MPDIVTYKFPASAINSEPAVPQPARTGLCNMPEKVMDKILFHVTNKNPSPYEDLLCMCLSSKVAARKVLPTKALEMSRQVTELEVRLANVTTKRPGTPLDKFRSRVGSHMMWKQKRDHRLEDWENDVQVRCIEEAIAKAGLD
ncbi:hypothetical protein LTR84_011487 [Exophiala bonariae]|uniref:F-box domain-containing protein n=1 Tax=Exophiala bonariae TaxID=1690606 RepID=A0AAV9NG59_9EURO|nr:hypothetical protein LTR84_011487 [Exophiala bonariae]